MPRIVEGQGQMYIFFDRRAELRTVEHLAQVDPLARAAVQVLDPHHPLGGDRVLVADLRRRDPATGYRRWIVSRGRWLEDTMPKVSVLARHRSAAKTPKVRVAVVSRPRRGVSRRGTSRRHRHPPRSRRHHRRKRFQGAPREPGSASVGKLAFSAKVPAPRSMKMPASRVKVPKVLLFGTAWCPSCRRARAYFLKKKLPFGDFDIERDPRAAQQYRLIQERAGLRPGVVPLIVVGQRAFQGFSEQRMEELLLRLGILKGDEPQTP